MFRIGIIGAGWIAEKMCDAIAHFTDMEIYAIASRTREKAEAFAAEHNIVFKRFRAVLHKFLRFFGNGRMVCLYKNRPFRNHSAGQHFHEHHHFCGTEPWNQGR